MRAPPRQARARDPSKVVDVEVVTPAAKNATNEKVVDPIVAVEATAKVENAIVVSPPAPAPAPTPSPAERTLPTTQQHIEAISDQLRIFRAGYDLRHRVEVDERGALKSDLQIKKRIWGLSRNKTIVAVVSLAVVTAAAGLGSTPSAWLPRLKSKLWPPTVVKPVRNGEMYGPPVPKHLLGRRQPKREPKPPPSLFEQIFGK